MNPILEACKKSLREAAGFLLRNNNKIQSTPQVIIKRYQTNTASLRVISLPNTPVKPARNTAVCNWKKAFFMGAQRKIIFLPLPYFERNDLPRVCRLILKPCGDNS